MKKVVYSSILYTLICLCVIVSSCSVDKIKLHEHRQVILKEDSELYELTFNGETHEFVMWHNNEGQCAVGGLCHWPGCKYCKERNGNNEEDNWLFK